MPASPQPNYALRKYCPSGEPAYWEGEKRAIGAVKNNAVQADDILQKIFNFLDEEQRKAGYHDRCEYPLPKKSIWRRNVVRPLTLTAIFAAPLAIINAMKGYFKS